MEIASKFNPYLLYYHTLHFADSINEHTKYSKPHLISLSFDNSIINNCLTTWSPVLVKQRYRSVRNAHSTLVAHDSLLNNLGFDLA